MFLRRWAKWSAGGVGAAGVAVAVCGVVHNSRTQSSLQTALKQNGTQPSVEVGGSSAVVFPWSRSRKDWELRKVSLTGYFMSDRFFVRKELNGQPGFLVIKPFVTAFLSTPDVLLPDEEERLSKPRGILVSTGWIPAGQARNFEEPKIGTPVVASPELGSDGQEYLVDNMTELRFPIVPEDEEPNEESSTPVRIEGYLRRPERKAWYAGNWQEDRTQQRNYVELRHILRQLPFDNLGDAQEYYLDLHWEKDSAALVGPSSAAESVALSESMVKGSHVYKMRGYVASASLLLLTSALIL